MKRFVMGLAVAACCAATPGTAGAVGTPDQEQLAPLDAVVGIDSGIAEAQVVTPGASGALDRVDLVMERFADATGPLSVEIRDTTPSGSPGSTVLATASVASSEVAVAPATGLVRVTFTSPAIVAAGVPVAVVTQTTSPNHYGMYGTSGDPYSGGAAWIGWGLPPAWSAFGDGFDAGFRTYVTPAYPFGGFLAPVDAAPVVNQVKAGSSVPVKFSLGGDHGLGVVAAGSPTISLHPCDGDAPTDAIEQTTTANQGLTYDAPSGTYTYVWKTAKSWSGQCGTFSLRLDDYTVHTAQFRFK